MRETLPDDPWHPLLHAPAVAEQADRRGRSRSEDGRGVYQKVGRDIQVLDPQSGTYRASAGKAEARRRGNPPDERHRGAFRALACERRSPGEIPVVHLSRCLPLLRRASRGDRAQRARCGSRDTVGFRLGPWPVRALAGGGMAARRALDRRRHRSRPCDGACAAAGVGGRSGQNGRAHRTRIVLGGDGRLSAACAASRLSTPAVPADARRRRSALRRDDIRNRRGALLAHGRRHRDRELQIADACDRRRRARRRAARAGRSRAQLHRARHLADRAAVFSRRQSEEDAGGRAAHALSARPALQDREARSRIARAESGAADRRCRSGDGRAARRSRAVARTVPGDDAGAEVLDACRRLRPSTGSRSAAGAKFVMHCDRAVATLESYIGLVEVGVGLLPGGGGCKEFALRAAAEAKGGRPRRVHPEALPDDRHGGSRPQRRTCPRARLSRARPT